MRRFAVALLMLVLSNPAHGQNEKGKWGFGAGGTMSNITSTEASKNSAGFGGEGILSYLFNDNLSLNLITGLNGFKITPTGASEMTTSLISSALTLEYEMKMTRALRPFLSLGIGAHNYSVDGGDRFSDGEGVFGGGTRIYFGKRTALYAAGLFKYTTGDALDGIDEGGKDMYYTVSAGLQFFRGRTKAAKIEEPKLTGTPFDKMPPVDSLLVEVLPEETPSDSSTKQEQRTLAEQIDQLEEKLQHAEQEISRMQQEITEKTEQIGKLEEAHQKNKPGFSDTDGVRQVYADALKEFNNRNYQKAIQMFQELVESYPENSLKSNFIYWTAECYYALNKYFQAAAEFEKVLGFATSPKKDDALLMLGRTYLQLGDVEAANSNFERLIVEFPRSEYKEKAEQYRQPGSVLTE
ncbi:MAG: tetratricopeptide repeat protein [Deferribacteres bacterium]|nr:tetratricopeptide repeat protein [candidate division KSB1 bacterium]MCB9500549.1 tetratricopeptide repeat protein [Deferribacteres bacterium]